ncbi:type ISP restriction/modification enzyme [Aerococcus urinaeequi]|uniref:type ISP restriction/modification enzyme n=1 Tax=Aerococcus urinaeequi TaxID=51665 RepID=UPI00366D773C
MNDPEKAGEIFEYWVIEISTNSDSWVINFSKENLVESVQRRVKQYETDSNNLKLNNLRQILFTMYIDYFILKNIKKIKQVTYREYFLVPQN